MVFSFVQSCGVGPIPKSIPSIFESLSCATVQVNIGTVHLSGCTSGQIIIIFHFYTAGELIICTFQILWVVSNCTPPRPPFCQSLSVHLHQMFVLHFSTKSLAVKGIVQLILRRKALIGCFDASDLLSYLFFQKITCRSSFPMCCGDTCSGTF